MAKDILDTIMNIQPKDSSGGGGETREAVVFRLADDMLGKLPPDYIPHEVRSRLQKMGAMSSMNIFLRQEIDRMQRVIALVRHTLQDLKLAIEGTIIMSEVMWQQWHKHVQCPCWHFHPSVEPQRCSWLHVWCQGTNRVEEGKIVSVMDEQWMSANWCQHQLAS